MKNTSSKFGTGIKFQNHKGTKHEKIKSPRSRIKCKRAQENNSFINWAWLQCKASKRERI